ncbi:MAG: FecR domain-containing protein [Bacteroidales bacterium]|jgi:hypothetical protein
MLTEEIIDLIVKKRLGTLSNVEEVKLERWVKDDNAEEFIKTVNTLETALELYETYKYYSQDLFKKKQMVNRRMHSKGYKFRRMLRYAAIIAIPLLFGAGIFYVYDNPYFQKTIPPGKEIAVMDLPNGDSVVMSSNIAKIYKSNGKEVIIPKVEVIDYLTLSGDFEEVNYSTIKVPHGGFYYVILSDGTVVWLNSNSKMRFPLKFQGSERKVWIEGEAYFDVTHDTIPFIVSTENQDIRVLGTTFNVTAYPGDFTTTTALISGSIVLQATGSQESVVLMPGQCATMNKYDMKVNLFEDDVQLYSLWKMGVFKFRERRLEDIVTVLKRWYDFDVEYESQSVKDMKFTTIALKNNPLDEVFRLLQMTTSITYKRRGNTVYLSE